jgi:membrane associated rhomboid family serine protease
MGMSARRYGNSFSLGGGGITRAIKTLLIVMTGVFILQTLAAMIGGQAAEIWIDYWFGLVPLGVVKGLRIWQPFTYIFLHGGLWHILINMLVLWMFGTDLERVWGARRFYNYFFICGIGAGLIDVAVNLIQSVFGRELSRIPTIGASGAIFGVLIGCAVLFPDRQVWLIPFPVTLSMRVYVAIMVAIEFFMTLSAPGDTVAHLCHLGGALIGYLYLRRGSFFFTMRNSMSDWKRKRMKRKFDVYMRDHSEPPNRPSNWVN